MGRFRLTTIIFSVVIGIILVRLFYWQVVAAQDLIRRGEKQYFLKLEIPAARGEIKTSDGFPVATNIDAYLIYARLPDLKKSPKEISDLLLPILADDLIPRTASDSARLDNYELIEDRLSDALNAEKLIWVALAHKVSADAKAKIEALNIAGIGFENEKERLYPEASMAAHILGIVGSDDNGRPTGYFGLEGYYDNQLRGRAGSIDQERDAQNRPILTGLYRPVEPKDGRNLTLTINRTIQYLVEKKLALAVEKYQAKSGSVVIINPQNGAILAMASYPNYNPQDWQQYGQDVFKNPAVADTYEPGSTFKVVAMSAAINEKEVKPNTKCDECGGPISIGGFTIRTWNNQYYPDTTMTEILQHSDNTGMVFVAQKLGLNKFYKYLRDFGFDRSTGVDLQDEAQTSIRPKDDWKEIDLATASFGQGIAVTALQMVQAVSVIANGGNLIKPHLVSQIQEGDKIIQIEPEIVKKNVISKETAQIVSEMMVNAVEKGEAQNFKPKNFRIAGKTGTAQIPVEGHYDPNKTIASFIGFAPVDVPKFLMLVRFTEPTVSKFGSETAAPTFFDISRDLFAYFGIYPGR